MGITKADGALRRSTQRRSSEVGASLDAAAIVSEGSVTTRGDAAIGGDSGLACLPTWAQKIV